ncbi:multisubunit sodium/proton antiporter MrpF subunit [Tibeticola sediminis]|jgi:multicomponent Na+:H+ antiporter subunit F|uniref:Multisubunit sodium/proton antiporter MrpF subunit n=1 Tax=Tibeticola sediminis TaxID=1917811 RepID=A0A3N4UI81_9BURK|nr:monovalent cation/H+ antiporter complex subunit F [Tibeticola sediminis]RPE66939.1 multisubunit sodium/proton antiporter MrpF subunit [Tibeticola sediminis]
MNLAIPGWALTVLFLGALGASALAAVRVLRGPTQADRVVALDIFLAAAVALCVATALASGHTAFLDVGLVLGLVGFIGTLGWSRLIDGAASPAEPEAQTPGAPADPEAP